MSLEQPPAVRPRLLVLASTYPRWAGDPEPGFVHHLARSLVDKFQVIVLCPHATGAACFERFDGVEVHRYRYAPAVFETLVNDGGIVANLKRHPLKWLLIPGFLLALLWSSLRGLKRWRPDVVHAHWLLPQGLVAAILKTLHPLMPPFLVTSHGADLFALRAHPLTMLKRFVASKAAAVTVVSPAMRDELDRIGVVCRRLDVEPMGVDLVSRFTADTAVERSRGELLFVGRLVEKKGVRHLLEAMPRILTVRPDAVLTIAGSGPEEQQLRTQAERLALTERVRFLGAVPQEQLPNLYRRAAVFVAPFVRAANGDEEGLGLVAIEAAGCGCPLVLGDVPAVRSALADVPGIRLVDAAQVTPLAEACLEAMQGPATDARAIEMLRARYDWVSRGRAYARILSAVIMRPNPGADSDSSPG